MTQSNGIITPRLSAYNMVDPKAVFRKPGHNPRFDWGDIGELAKSIKYQAIECYVPGGLLNAIIIKRRDVSSFELVDGDRRLHAVELLLKWHAEGKPEGYDFPDGIPARLAAKDQTEVAGLIQMFEANTGKPFLPLEEAAAYQSLREAGLSIEAICKAVQRAHVHVVKTLALVDADESLKAAVASGEVGGTIAKDIAVAAKGDKAKQKELTQAAVGAGKKDKKALAKVKAQIEEARQAKAAKAGKVLKIRALTDEQLSGIGAKLAKHLASLMKEAKLPEDQDMMKWVEEDEKLAAAYAFGALQALKVAAGVKDIKLEI